VVPKVEDSPDPLRKIDLKSALQYGTAQGYPPLYAWIKEFSINHLHPNIPYKDGPEVVLTCGSTDGFAKTVEALTNVWSEGHDPVSERPGLLLEEFAYGNASQSTAKPRGMNLVPVAVDDQGMAVEGENGLRNVLENWDYNRGMKPHLMYTITIGQNPTGGVLSVQRRKDIYALCVEHDIIIVEDDPYWYLQYPSAAGKTPNTNYNTPKSSGYEFLDSLVPSYLSVDYQGRVVRIDTFSKTVAPGCRLGWITCQPVLAERILRIAECTTQQPSGFVQSMIAELIMGPQQVDDRNNGARGGSKDGKGWKVAGWVRWLEGLRGNYERRMNIMAEILDDGKYVVKTGRRPSITAAVADSEDGQDWAVVEKTSMFEFVWPMGGMFLWMKILFDSHPLYKKVAHDKLARALWIHLTTKPYLVLVAPGAMFSANEGIVAEKGWKYFRICFAAVDDREVEECSKRFVAGMKSFWGKRKVGDIEELWAMGEQTAAEEVSLGMSAMHVC
jgi:DNA-binding transcriptional MocR family regulator